MIRCPRCFKRDELGIHVCAPLAPVRQAPVRVRTVEEPRRKPGRLRKDPTAAPRVKGPRGGARVGAGRPRGRSARFDDATLIRANELRLAGKRWAEVGATLNANGEQLRQAIAHRRTQDADLFPRTGDRGGRPSLFTAAELGAAQRMRELGMPWDRVASNLSVANLGQFQTAFYRRAV